MCENTDWSEYAFDLPAPGEAGLSDNDNPLVNTTNRNKGIFFTINPSDNYWIKRAPHSKLKNHSLSDQFRYDISNVFMEIQRIYRKKQIKLDIHIHFEKTDRLHSHGVITGFTDSYYGYQGELDKISRILHKTFGKPRLRSSICADLKWTNESWDGSYIVKQNYLTPIRLIYN